MSAISPAVVSEAELYSARAKNLIIGRLALIFVLLLASWWWTSGYLDRTIEFPDSFFLFFASSLALSCIYLLLRRFNAQHWLQIRLQIAIDIALITWLVWETGVATSPYIPLYVVLISVSAFLLRKDETLGVGILSGGALTAVSVLGSGTVDAAVPPGQVIQIIGFNVVALLLVGLLSARVSERRAISEELRHTAASFEDLHILHERIVDSISTGLITTDLSGRIYAYNKAAEQISGISASEAVGQSAYALLGEDKRARIENCLKRAQASENADPCVFETVLSVGSQNGTRPTQITVSFSVAPLLSKVGSVTGLIFMFQDISRVKELEANLRRADRLAAVGRMAAGLAHELRNPLGSMSSALQFLQQQTQLAERESGLMNVVLNESDRLNSIITNFLAYARPSANGLAAQERCEIDLAQTIGDCVALLRHSPEVTESHSIELSTPPYPVHINASETQIKQVVWNVLQNGLQAMPEGGRLSVNLKNGNGKLVRIAVADSGCGIDEESLDHLFEPFSSGSGGMGLGLSIVHKIISDHGGRINVQSRVGIGTTVNIELPQ